MNVLSEHQRQQFFAEGYLVVENVVDTAHCDRVVEAMCNFIGVDITQATSFANYRKQGHGIVPLHHHQALWDVRQLPQVHEIFSALFGSENLWVTQDRVSFKVPSSVLDEPFRMDAVHWDGDPRLTEIAMQGLVYLSDTPADRGAFGMVPALYKSLDTWLETAPPQQLRRPDVSPFPLVPVPGKKGSLVIWHRRMPHTSLENRSEAPRLVQYVSMMPANNNSDARLALAKGCLEKRPPHWAIVQNVPGQQNPEPGPPVRLTALGRKLAAIDAW